MFHVKQCEFNSNSKPRLGCQFTQDYHASIRGKKKSDWALVVADLHTALLLEEMDRSVSLTPGAKAILSWIGESDYPVAFVTSSDRSYIITY